MVEPVTDVDLARLAGVVALSVEGRGPRRAFVFEPHRLALPCWAHAGGGRPALLVTLDRHLDLVRPARPPPPGLTVLELDRWAREQLDVRNVDHVLAAMEAGVVSDALVVARTRLPEGVAGETYLDARGQAHRLVVAPTVDRLSADFGAARASPEGRVAAELLAAAPQVLLDLDLDCFTTLSDADPTAVVPWPEALIREHLLPRGSEAFWDAVLAKCVGLTFAREPGHCGGLVAAGRLFEAAAKVVFEELLGADVP